MLVFPRLTGPISLLVVLLLAGWGKADEPPPTFANTVLTAGFAQKDITPPPGLPMWGYGARHDALADGVLDPLYAKALVLGEGDQRVALVGLDLGRGPTPLMMRRIRERIEAEAHIAHVIVSGSHTHHGPVIELTDREGYGRDRFPAAVEYAQKLPEWIADVIVEASTKAAPARIGMASREVPLNRNRQSHRAAKPVDSRLAVLRVDDQQGQPLAVLVNYAAHPVMTDPKVLKYSADWPGFMQQRVQQTLQTPCMFMQGAAGDMSPQPGEALRGPQKYGEALAGHVLELASNITTAEPSEPSLKGRTERMVFRSRVDFQSLLVRAAFAIAFFPELVRNFADECSDGIAVELNVLLLHGQLAIVSGSGEFFASHAIRLRQRAYFDDTLFFGYANGHNLYFPTIEAVSEGGYGADKELAPAEIGAGERVIDRALILLYTLAGKFPNGS